MNLTNVLRMKQQHDTCVAYLHIYTLSGLSFCFLFAISPISLFPIILILVVRILYYTTRISIRMLANLYKRQKYVRYKCVAIDQNGLRTASEYCMLRICVFTNLRNMFLKFAKSREQPRMYTNTNECKAITMRPLRFVTELQRYYVILLLHLSEYLTNGLTTAIRHQFALIAV